MLNKHCLSELSFSPPFPLSLSTCSQPGCQDATICVSLLICLLVKCFPYLDVSLLRFFLINSFPYWEFSLLSVSSLIWCIFYSFLYALDISCIFDIQYIIILRYIIHIIKPSFHLQKFKRLYNRRHWEVEQYLLFWPCVHQQGSKTCFRTFSTLF